MKVLIVDDKAENLYLLELILKDAGFTSVSAKNGLEALEILEKETFDIVVADILMPIMDGFTLCREMKKNKSLYKIPFIFYTATYTDPKDEEFALSLGADRFLLKPKEPDEFVQIVKEVLKESETKKFIAPIEVKESEKYLLQEYNQTLVRKLEDKMLQAEKAEKEVRKYNIALLKEIDERKKISDALQSSEIKYRSFFENSMDAILLTSPEGKIHAANPAACKMFGFSEEEFAVLRREDIVDTHDPRLAPMLKERERRGKVRGELTMIRRDGRRFTAEISTSIFSTPEGYSRTSMIIRDITDRKEAEEALNKSINRYKNLTNISPVGIFHTDAEGSTTFVNPSWCEISGLSAEKALGFGWIDAVHPEDKEILVEGWKSSTKAQSVSFSDYRFIRPNGETAWVIGQAVPETNSEGEIIGYIGTITDITARKKAETEIIMLANALRCIKECVSITDLENTIIFVNESFLKTYGYTKEELIGKHMSLIRPSDIESNFGNAILDSTIKGGWTGELLNKKKDGTIFPVHLSTSVIKDKAGKILGLIGVATDITQTKKAQQELISAKEKAELSDRLKTEFLAQVSHEIRTPLNAVINLSSLVKEETAEIKSEDLDIAFYGIESAGKRLIRTVDSILNMSELQLGAYQTSIININLCDLLKKLTAESRNLAKSKNLTIEFKSECKDANINGDDYALSQIFSHLIDNALRYTEKGGVEISVYENENGKISVVVSDTGIGISEEYLPNLFKEFTQEEQGYGRRFEGNGLGLALVKKYCDIINADIAVQSKKQEGTTFTITLN